MGKGLPFCFAGAGSSRLYWVVYLFAVIVSFVVFQFLLFVEFKSLLCIKKKKKKSGKDLNFVNEML